jgi:hypothetical protein
MENSLQPTQIDTFDVRLATGTNGTVAIGIELSGETNFQQQGGVLGARISGLHASG